MKKNFLLCNFKLLLPKIILKSNTVRIEITTMPNRECDISAIYLKSIIIRDDDNHTCYYGEFDTEFDLTNGQTTKYLEYTDIKMSRNSREYSIEMFFFDKIKDIYTDVYYEMDSFGSISLSGVNTYFSYQSSHYRALNEKIKSLNDSLRIANQEIERYKTSHHALKTKVNSILSNSQIINDELQKLRDIIQ